MGINLGSVMMMKLGGLAPTDPEQVSVSSITLFVTLLCICVVLGHLLEENRWINESVNSLIIGLGTGAILLLATNGVSSRILEFNEELFFIYLLPPIIFNAGFQVKKKHFFRNFMTITLFGAVGTMISFGIISLGAKLVFDQLSMGYFELRDYLANNKMYPNTSFNISIHCCIRRHMLEFGWVIITMHFYAAIGAIFSATDSVCTLQVLNQDETPFLYSLVFGEGVVNDATSVVLFNAIQKFDLSEISSRMALKFIGDFFYLFISSTLLGILMGLLSAYIIKRLYFGRHSTDREVALMILMAYLSYIMAELFDLSGILTVFFCGIVMSHYTWHNVTESSRVTTKHVFATMSFIAETFIFLYVGMDALDLEKWKFATDSPGKSIGASAGLFGLVLVGRAAFIFPLSFLFNLMKKSRSDRLSLKQQGTIWWAGLTRGAVSMALAYNQFAKSGHTKQPGNALMITCTITVVLFSTVVFGLLTKHLVRFLFNPSNNSNDIVPSEPSSPTSPTLPLIYNGEGSEANGTSIKNGRRPSSLQMLLSAPSHTVHYYWRKFDDAFMRPVFGGRGFTPFIPGTPREESDDDQLVG